MKHSVADAAATTAFPWAHSHPLYGRLERFEDAPLLTPERLAAYTAAHPVAEAVTEFGECPRCYFQTSGTSGHAKRIPFSEMDLERQIEHEARSFAIAGLTPADHVLTLASPPPSLSAWATVHGSERLGATLVNSSYVDFDVPVERGYAATATFVFGTPLMLEMIGETCVEAWGSVPAAFPNVRAGILYGDLLPAPLERRLRALWDIDVRLLYGSVEADVIAISCPDGDRTMHVMSEQVIVELLPEQRVRPGAGDATVAELVPVADVPTGSRGEVVVSDLGRELLPLIRYRTGDMVEIVQGLCACGRDGPRLRVLGRRANIVELGGRPLHELELHEVVEEALGRQWDDWSAQVSDNAGPRACLVLRVQTQNRAHAVQAIGEQLARLGVLDPARPGAEQLIVELAPPRQATGLVATGDVKADRLSFS
ncbi:MAG: GH3 auxin-responsive promoter family protein [Conexibacter sp.]